MTAGQRLNTKDRKALEELRQRIPEVLDDFKNDFTRHDASLVKFLRARDYNVGETEKMIRKTIEWRKANGVDRILKRPICQQLHDCITYHLTGFDQLGHPVLLAPMGRWNTAAALHPDIAEEAVTMLIQYCEQIMELFREISTESHMITSYFPILDLGGFDYTFLVHTELVTKGLALLREAVQILLNNYPEAMHRIVIINAPAIFQMAWSVVKPMLTARSLSRIHIFGSNKEAWKKILLENIEPDGLPSQYGGANTTCLITNRFTLDHGLVELPSLEQLPKEDLLTHDVAPGKKFTIEIPACAGDKIVWNFNTEEHDIGFQLDYENDPKSIIDNFRADSHRFLQKGVYVCQKTGKYTLVFDNTFSYRTQKKLRYAIVRRRASSPCNVN